MRRYEDICKLAGMESECGVNGKRLKRKPSRWNAAGAFLLTALAAFLLAPFASRGGPALVRVVRVIDGDTIQVCCVAGKKEKVRYIGINTPETKHAVKGVEYYGKEAAEANRKLVADKTVRLEFDVDRRDKYGRLLAYVYLEDGTFVNALLVQNGYAQIMTIPPNVTHQELFLRLQREAREAGRGLWK